MGQVTALDNITYEVMFIAVEDEEGKVVIPTSNVWLHCLYISGKFFITKVSYVEQRSEQRTVEHDKLVLVRRRHTVVIM